MCWIENVPFTDYTIEHCIGSPHVEIIKSTKPYKFRENSRIYKNLCWRLTNKVAYLVPDIHLRSFKGHHIDHIVSIAYGFRNNINPHLIASLDNLRMLPKMDNLVKGTKLTNEAKELLSRWELCSYID
jgi:hypothetical protein